MCTPSKVPTVSTVGPSDVPEGARWVGNSGVSACSAIRADLLDLNRADPDLLAGFQVGQIEVDLVILNHAPARRRAGGELVDLADEHEVRAELGLHLLAGGLGVPLLPLHALVAEVWPVALGRD